MADGGPENAATPPRWLESGGRNGERGKILIGELYGKDSGHVSTLNVSDEVNVRASTRGLLGWPSWESPTDSWRDLLVGLRSGDPWWGVEEIQ